MKKILLLTFLIFSFFSFGQKVKLKKNIVYIDDKEVFHYEEIGFNTTFSTLSGKEFLSVNASKYEVPKTIPTPSYMSKTWTEYIYKATFLNSGKNLITDIGNKELIKQIYKYGIVDENGNVDEGKIDILINKFNNEDLKLKLIK